MVSLSPCSTSLAPMMPSPACRKTKLQMQGKCSCRARAFSQTCWPTQVESRTELRGCVLPFLISVDPRDALANAGGGSHRAKRLCDALHYECGPQDGPAASS